MGLERMSEPREPEFRIAFDGVSLKRGERVIFDRLSCGFPRGRVSVVLGGSGAGNLGGVEAAPVATQGYFHSLFLTLPPLSVLYLKPATSA